VIPEASCFLLTTHGEKWFLIMDMIESSAGPNSNYDWKTIASNLLPGGSYPDCYVSVRGGAIVYACMLSPSVGLFTIVVIDGNCSPDSTDSVLDVVLKKDDGWKSTEISNVVSFMRGRISDDIHCHYQNVSVSGFVERMRAKSSSDTSPLCLHAKWIRFESHNGAEKLSWTSTSAEATVISSKDEQHSHLVCPQRPLSPSNERWREAKDDSRFSTFATFLLQTIGGYESLSRKPVLDIAGGAGGLAFELSVRHSIPCIVVDNKLVRFDGKQLRHIRCSQSCVERLYNHNDKPFSEAFDETVSMYKRHEDLQLSQIQTLLNASRIG
jgi:hypothetical protein